MDTASDELCNLAKIVEEAREMGCRKREKALKACALIPAIEKTLRDSFFTRSFSFLVSCELIEEDAIHHNENAEEKTPLGKAITIYSGYSIAWKRKGPNDPTMCLMGMKSISERFPECVFAYTPSHSTELIHKPLEDFDFDDRMEMCAHLETFLTEYMSFLNSPAE